MVSKTRGLGNHWQEFWSIRKGSRLSGMEASDSQQHSPGAARFIYMLGVIGGSGQVLGLYIASAADIPTSWMLSFRGSAVSGKCARTGGGRTGGGRTGGGRTGGGRTGGGRVCKPSF